MAGAHPSRRLVALLSYVCIAPVQPTRADSGWTDLPQRWKTTGEIVNDSSAVLEFPGPCHPDRRACRMVAIQTGPISTDSILEGEFKGTHVEELRFRLTDKVAGAKSRLEATTCFVTAADLEKRGIDPSSEESKMLQAIHFVYQNCSGAATADNAAIPVAHNVSYSMLLPANFSSQSQAILGQFHGRPDPRWFMDPRSNKTMHLSTAAAYGACHNPEGGQHDFCNEGQIKGGPLVGWRYKQGGYPPLSFGYADGLFYVVGRSDDRIFVPKADCGFNPSRSYWPDGRLCPGGVHEQVHGIWRAPFSALPLGHWLHFRWNIVWSAYAENGGKLLRNGTIHLQIVAEGAIDQLNQSRDEPVIVDVHWEGPLGRHDDGRAPFFKLGMYNPSGDTRAMQVSYRDFEQAFQVMEKLE